MSRRRSFSCEDRRCRKTYWHEPVYVPGTSTGACDEFPNPKPLRPMIRDMRNNLGAFTCLLEYAGIRYIFLFRYNKETADCVENGLLDKIHEAIEDGDKGRLEELAEKSMELFWPFLKADYESQAGTHTDAKISRGMTYKKARLMVVKTVDGVLQPSFGSLVFPTQEVLAIENRFPDLKLFGKDDVEEMEALPHAGEIVHILKVKIHGSEYCLKKLPVGTLDIFRESQILREFRLLQQIPRHPNLRELIGVKDAEDGKIDGIVLRYIYGKQLSKVQQATEIQKRKWKRQVSEAVRVLHERDLVWGDAKPHNIMTEEESDNAILIDFGGGASTGWVDYELCETKEGDLQGLSRTLDFIDKISEGGVSKQYGSKASQNDA